jgi:hypothetical protein
LKTKYSFQSKREEARKGRAVNKSFTSKRIDRTQNRIKEKIKVEREREADL